MNDEPNVARDTLCVWAILAIVFALIMLGGSMCPVYGQAPLSDPPVYKFGWGIVTGTAPVDVTLATAKNLYGVPAVIDRYGRERSPAIPCQWSVTNWPIHPTPTKQFTVYLVRVHNGVASRVSAAALPFGPCDKAATTTYTVRDAAKGFVSGDRLYVEFNAALELAQCGTWTQQGNPVPAPLWCGPVFATGGVVTAPAMEGFRR